MDGKHIHIGLVCDFFLTDWSGVERVFAGLAAELLRRGHRVTILAQKPSGPVSPKIPLTPLPEGCELTLLDWNSENGRVEARSALMQGDYDVIAAPCAGRKFLRVPRLLSGSGIPLAAAECIDPQVLTYERWEPYEHFGALALCDTVQILLEDFREFYPPAMRGRIVTAGNPVPAPKTVDWGSRAQRKKHTLLGVGRFDEKDKQFSLLLRTWQLLAPEFPDWTLTLVGDGRDFELYQAMAKALGEAAPVVLTGGVADPDPFYEAADVFCMPSRTEGFGLVLGEAAAWGLPLVALRQCAAARALIKPEFGALSENSSPAALAGALRPLMAADPAERRRAGEAAQAFFEENYSMERVADLWEDMLLGAAEYRGRTRQDTLALGHWDEALLGQAGLELLSRGENVASSGEAGGFSAALARLQSERDGLEKELHSLQRRFDALARQAQTGRRR